jgi:hypothetical protein
MLNGHLGSDKDNPVPGLIILPIIVAVRTRNCT